MAQTCNGTKQKGDCTMRVVEILNNNYILAADADGNEYIVMGSVAVLSERICFGRSHDRAYQRTSACYAA